MKRIKLKEEQLRLFETIIKEEDAPNFDGGPVKEYGDESESGKIAPENISDVDGNKQLGSAEKQLKEPEELTQQNYWLGAPFSGRRVSAY